MKPKSDKTEVLEVQIEKIVPNGFGLARQKDLTIFVALAALGDKLRVRIDRKQKNIAFASIVEIIEPSSLRVKPECQYFGVCGGCDFQQMNYAAQLEAKISIIRDCLQRIGKIEYNEEIKINSADAWKYRTRAQWKFDPKTRKLGYFERNSHKVCDVAECPILTEKLQQTLTKTRQSLSSNEINSTEVVEIEIVSSHTEISLIEVESTENQRTKDKGQRTKTISQKVGEFEYFYDAECFFQVNHFLLETFVSTALKDFRGQTALDLYCGVGLFTLPLSRRFAKVWGIEGNPESIKFARQNAAHANLSNVQFETESVGKWLVENQYVIARLDFVLLDPPRDGAEREAIETLLEIEPTRICYVSCDPATLARDLRLLLTKYQIVSIEAFDFFPQTHHIETIVHLKKLTAESAENAEKTKPPIETI